MSLHYPDMRERLTEPTVRLLNQWANHADKETWSENPEDRERWMAWIVAAHEENAEPPLDVLRRWLMRGCGWPEDKAERTRLRLAAE